MILAQYPVTFMGQATGLTAPSRRVAAGRVYIWIAQGKGPTIPAEYLPVMPPAARVPNLTRLYRNTARRGDAFEVGLGLPDRRQGPRKAPAVSSPADGR